MDDLIETMESALSDFSARNVSQPLRTVLQVGAQKAFFGVTTMLHASRRLCRSAPQ